MNDATKTQWEAIEVNRELEWESHNPSSNSKRSYPLQVNLCKLSSSMQPISQS